MTITSRAMEWLNHNRHRSYPMERDAWRSKVSPESGLDSVLLDATVIDTDASGDETLSLESVEIGDSGTVIAMAYGGRTFSIDLHGGEESGEGSFECRRGSVRGTGMRGASMSLSFSSHAYLHSVIGKGRWELGCNVLCSRVVRLSDGYGVDYISTNGSKGVEGHESPADVKGDVVLEDGYRTSPIIYDGRVLVRVGRRFGYDPCFYEFTGSQTVDCSRPLFYFCGQNAVNNGNIVLKGGKGISVTQGRDYLVNSRKSKCYGKRVPCIEIVAGRELLDLYSPGVGAGGGTGGGAGWGGIVNGG